MKKSLLIIITTVVCLNLSGQQITQQLNSYRSNEVVTKQQVWMNIDKLLENNRNVWSLEEAEISKDTYSAEYKIETDTLKAVDATDRTYYNQDRNSVNGIGSENYMEHIRYDMPETWLKFPMHVGDSVSGYFNGSGPYCERFFMRRFGTYKTKADATGVLVLPLGDSLRNVIRLHTERHVGTIALSIDTMKHKIPTFTVDSIIRHIAPDSAKMREDIYRWYAEGYRYPILEAKITSYLGERLTEEIFYCPPETQRTLSYDAANESERQRIEAERAMARNSVGNTDNNIKNMKAIGNSFTYEILQNEGTNEITVNYNASSNLKVITLVANTQGHVFKRTEQQCEAGTGQFTINCNGLRQGQYILYINVEGNQAAEKVNINGTLRN